MEKKPNVYVYYQRAGHTINGGPLWFFIISYEGYIKIEKQVTYGAFNTAVNRGTVIAKQELGLIDFNVFALEKTDLKYLRK